MARFTKIRQEERPATTGVAFGMSWDDSKVGRPMAILLVLALLAGALAAAGPSTAGDRLVSVIVREDEGAGDRPEALVRSLHGRVDRQLPIISGFAASVPAGALPRLAGAPGIRAVTPNGAVRLAHAVDGFDASTDLGSMHLAARLVGATSFWSAGYTGNGVDVALIDSGVVPVEGLDLPGKIVNGPDLSFEAGVEGLRHLDTYGHGTHMAGIIAGRDAITTSLRTNELKANHDDFIGIAPDARVVSVKVAGHSGATDVSQVIAAIDWVVQHRTSHGLNIRVLNLSFGTDGVQDYVLDPLAYAAEVAWHRGIVVVVAAGNGGYGTTKLNNPAYDPYLLAVGASDPKGTMGSSDDVVPSFSSTGDGHRNPDVVAPGKSIVSVRVPGSYLDTAYPGGRAGGRFFRGSGTSQSAAVVSGMAALIVQRHPTITPDAVKQLLVDHAKRLPEADPIAQGAGMAFLDNTNLSASVPEADQRWPLATGLGSLEQARGSAHVVIDGTLVEGERTVFGSAWDAGAWAEAAWQGNTWSGNTWQGNTWSGNTWQGNTWSGNTWSGNTWSGAAWQ